MVVLIVGCVTAAVYLILLMTLLPDTPDGIDYFVAAVLGVIIGLMASISIDQTVLIWASTIKTILGII